MKRKSHNEWITEHSACVKKFKKKIPYKDISSNKACEEIESDSWFDIKTRSFPPKNMIKCNPSELEEESQVMYCRKVIIFPTEKQKEILFKWFEGYRKMYNDTIRLIRYIKYGFNYILIDWKEIRTRFMKDDKSKYMKLLGIPSHILDGAIKNACASYKSAMTNCKRGNIKHFVIRYIKKSKKNKVLNLEQINFTINGFFPRFLGIMISNKQFDFRDIVCDPKLYYDSNKNRFMLLVPDTKAVTYINNDESYIGLDGGVRSYLTGISNKNVIEIGTNLFSVLKKDLRKLDKIQNNKKIPQKIKKKYEKRINRRIQNKVSDLHWKSIDYLTSNYDNIIIGNLSTKSIVNNNTSKLTAMTKRIALKMAFYQFLERLKYKCQSKNIHLQIVNEYLTSKLCSNCSAYNDVGSSKIYRCVHCGLIIDRDINGAINICMRGFEL